MELMVLTNDEQDELDGLEQTIERNLASFLEIGRALITIRDKRLYRPGAARNGYDTFEAYCRERWKFSKTHANRFIESTKVIKNLTPIGVIPENEAQARPLAKLPPEQQQEAWDKVVETAPDGKVTAKHVEEVVDKYLDPRGFRSPQPPCFAIHYAGMAISQLKRITDDDITKEQALDEVETWIKEKRLSWKNTESKEGETYDNFINKGT